MQTTERAVLGILSKYCEADSQEDLLQLSLSELGMQSLDLIECLFTIEEELGIELDEAALKSIRVVADLIREVDRSER